MCALVLCVDHYFSKPIIHILNPSDYKPNFHNIQNEYNPKITYLRFVPESGANRKKCGIYYLLSLQTMKLLTYASTCGVTRIVVPHIKISVNELHKN